LWPGPPGAADMAVVLAPLAGAGTTVSGHPCAPAHRVILALPQLWPSNRLVTEPSLYTSLIARASSGAIDSTVSLSNCFS